MTTERVGLVSDPAGRRQASSPQMPTTQMRDQRAGADRRTAPPALYSRKTRFGAQLWEVPTARLPEHGLRENVAEFFPRRRRCALRAVPGAAAQSGGTVGPRHGQRRYTVPHSALPNPLSLSRKRAGGNQRKAAYGKIERRTQELKTREYNTPHDAAIKAANWSDEGRPGMRCGASASDAGEGRTGACHSA